MPVLFRGFQRDVRTSRRDSAERIRTIPSAVSLWDQHGPGFDLTRNYREAYGLHGQ
jgi:hypothetical protein